MEENSEIKTFFLFNLLFERSSAVTGNADFIESVEDLSKL